MTYEPTVFLFPQSCENRSSRFEKTTLEMEALEPLNMLAPLYPDLFAWEDGAGNRLLANRDRRLLFDYQPVFGSVDFLSLHGPVWPADLNFGEWISKVAGNKHDR